MSAKILGLDSTVLGLQRTGKKTSARQLKLMRSYSLKIRDEAKELAPVDEGNLEKAIKVLGEDRLGTRRNVILVGVDENELGLGYQRNGFRYDIYTHEFLTSIGPLSQAKAASNGKVVGRKYLERAAEHFRDQIIDELEQIASEEASR